MGRKTHITTIRLDDVEYKMVEDLTRELGVSKSEVFRRLLWTVRTIFSSYLSVEDAVISVDADRKIDFSKVTLSEVLKSIPELMDSILRRMERENKNKKQI